ncbi:MAG: beta-ketoacyl-ACP synthase II [Chloroflexota bacterium]
METRRVVVTGMGVISPLGLTPEDMWTNLVAGKSGVGRITSFDASTHTTRIAAEVKGFDILDYIDRKRAKNADLFTQFAIAAALRAVENARLPVDATNGDEIGVLIGSGTGGIATIYNQMVNLLQKGPDRVSAFTIPMMIGDSAAGQISIILGARGPNFCSVSSCSSSADAIGEACEIVKRGDARTMIAGGSEAAVNPFAVAAFDAARALSGRNDEPQKASRPFDAERDGFVMGDGAAILVLEELSFALGRGAQIIGEVVGYGATSDAFHITQPATNGVGAARAMKRALDKAGLRPEQIDYINAHGTSTPLNDRNETAAIKSAFGAHAYRVPVSSTKSMTGHLLGGAGAVEAVICLLAIKHGIIPPTINLEHPDPECDLDYVPNVARQAKVRTAMSNSFGFGGHNSVLILREYSG